MIPGYSLGVSQCYRSLLIRKAKFANQTLVSSSILCRSLVLPDFSMDFLPRKEDKVPPFLLPTFSLFLLVFSAVNRVRQSSFWFLLRFLFGTVVLVLDADGSYPVSLTSSIQHPHSRAMHTTPMVCFRFSIPRNRTLSFACGAAGWAFGVCGGSSPSWKGGESSFAPCVRFLAGAFGVLWGQRETFRCQRARVR